MSRSIGPDATTLLNRLRYKLAADRVLVAGYRLAAALAKYDPGQPRKPSGQPGGGQWTSGTSGGGSSSILDPTGDASWSEIVNTFADDGSFASQFITNRDGSGIFTEFGNATTAWDERSTVVTSDGAELRFETSGYSQSITDVASGQPLSQNTWTDAGPVPEGSTQPVLWQGAAVEKTLEAAGIL